MTHDDELLRQNQPDIYSDPSTDALDELANKWDEDDDNLVDAVQIEASKTLVPSKAYKAFDESVDPAFIIWALARPKLTDSDWQKLNEEILNVVAGIPCAAGPQGYVRGG